MIFFLGDSIVCPGLGDSKSFAMHAHLTELNLQISPVLVELECCR